MSQQIWALTIYNGDTFDQDSGRIFYDEELLVASTAKKWIMRELDRYILIYPKPPRIIDTELTPTYRLDVEPGTLIVHTLNTV